MIMQLESTLHRGVSLFPEDVKLLNFSDKFRRFLAEVNVEGPHEDQPKDVPVSHENEKGADHAVVGSRCGCRSTI